MAKIEDTPRKLVLKEGSTTLTLDKDSGKATLQQKVLLWSKKPIEFALADIDDIAVKSDQGRAFRCDDPSQRLAQAFWRDHRSNHRGSQGCRGHSKKAPRVSWTLVFGRQANFCFCKSFDCAHPAFAMWAMALLFAIAGK